MAVAAPYIARMPSIMIGAVDLVCHARKVSLVPEDTTVDVETFCNPGGEAPGTTSWMCEIEALQSFGVAPTAGLWDTLRPLAKTIVTFIVKPNDAVVSATNPSATFSAYVPSIPFIDSQIGASTTMTIGFKVIGEPVFSITP